MLVFHDQHSWMNSFDDGFHPSLFIDLLVRRFAYITVRLNQCDITAAVLTSDRDNNYN